MLRAIGVGGGVAMLGGVASAKPGNRGRGGQRSQQNGNSADPKRACGGCPAGYTYEKIDGAPEKGDEYTLSSGVVITITDVEKNDDEVVGIQIAATGFVDKLCVKGGPITEVYEDLEPSDLDSTWFYAPDNPNSGKRYQISNVAYCTTEGARYQADLVAGYPICDFDPTATPPITYTGQGRRLTSNFANFGVSPVTASQNDVTGSTPSYRDTDECFTQTSASGDFHSLLPTATGFEGTFVNRDTNCGPDPFYVTLVVYHIPEGVADNDYTNQVLVGATMLDATSMPTGSISFDLTTDMGGSVDCVTTQA